MNKKCPACGERGRPETIDAEALACKNQDCRVSTFLREEYIFLVTGKDGYTRISNNIYDLPYPSDIGAQKIAASKTLPKQVKASE